ncbi:MAG: hypothetical protein OXG60_07175 [Chloroflexi bacterium]|nr:hypothetical protein [Chloroflexota bacterium]
MAWTTPKTWTSEPLTSVDLNTYVRDNQNHLKDRIDNSVSNVVSGIRNYSTTATEWVDVDPQDLALTLQTHGGDVLLGFIGAVSHSGDSKVTYFNIAVDESNYFSDDGVTQFQNPSQNDVFRFKPLSIVVMIPSLPSGSHVFKLRWKTLRGNMTAMDIVKTHPQFWAKEI